MKNFLTTALGIILFLTVAPLKSNAQSPALAYMDNIGKEFKLISNDMWDYISAVSHNKGARKQESRRKDLLKTLQSAQNNVSKMSDFKGDTSYRSAVLSYLKVSYYVMDKDYGKLVDMEEIAEESYDKMEAYMLAQQKANDKLDDAEDVREDAEEAFADNNNIKLVENQDKTQKKLETAGKVFTYYNKVYLVFFKSYKQEAYLMDALKKNDVNGIEQNKNSLITFAAEGLSKLDTMKSFKGDNSLKTTCRSVLEFYQSEAKDKIPVLENFYLTKEKFDKIKSSFDAKAQSARTQADVDEYNKAVKDYNDGVNSSNTVNEELNKKRAMFTDKWNDDSKSFLNTHVPKKK